MKTRVLYNQPKEKLSSCDDIPLLEKILTIAGRSHGRVYGGFVRDVIVPRLIDPNNEVNFNDVDIWFTKQEDVNNFLRGVNLYLEPLDFNLDFSKRSIPKPGVLPNTFARTQYSLWTNKNFVSFIDVIVCKVIPVDDFNVNCLTFQYVNDKKKAKSFGPDSTTKLIDDIMDKQAYMLLSYPNKLISGRLSNEVFERRVNNNYLNKGWKVFCFDRFQFPRKISDEWIDDTFKPIARKYFDKLNKLQ